MNTFTIKLASLCALLAVAGSCTFAEKYVNPESYDTVITATMQEPSETIETRTCIDVTNSGQGTLGILWHKNDAIGVYGDNGTRNAMFSCTSSDRAPKADFSGTMTAGDAPYRAYYPYNEDNKNAAIDNLKGTIPETQEFDSSTGLLTADYKYGEPVSGTKKFTFRHLFSMLRFTIDVTGSDIRNEYLESIELTVVDADGAPRGINGSFTFSAIDGAWKDVTGSTNKIVMPWTDQPMLLEGETITGFVTLLPTIVKGDRISVRILTDRSEVNFTATCQVDKFEEEYVYNIPLTIAVYQNRAEEFEYSKVDRVDLAAAPTIESFKFTVAKNTGKLLDNKTVWNSSNNPEFQSVKEHVATVSDSSVDLMIPYLYDFKLVPEFTLSSADAVVTVDGVKQESGVTEADFSQPVTYTVSAPGCEAREYVVNVRNTGLPVVVVKQSSSGDFSEEKDGGIFGTTTNKFVNFWVRGKEAGWVKDDVINIYNANGSIRISNATCGVKLRGNTTKTYPKKPFAIKFTADDGVDVLGMGKPHMRWVLLANWLDHSMMRNTVAFDIAHAVENAWRANPDIGEGIPWNVHGENVELVIFSKEGVAHHVGNYYLCEQIKIDVNRLNINPPYEDVPGPTFETCGYLLEIDNNYDEVSQFKSGTSSLPIMFKDEVPTDILNKVKEKVDIIDEKIYSGEFAAAYENYDINSAVDQWLILELTMNREYCDPRSVYHFMNGDGKLCAGPVWDFDRATFQNPERATDMSNQRPYRLKNYNEWICWKLGKDEDREEAVYLPVWYAKLINDPIFQAKVQERWAVMYPYLSGVVANIRQYGVTMAASYEVNNAMWPTTEAAINKHKKNFYDWSGDEKIEDWNEVVDNFVQCYEARLSGMNTLITTGKFTK